jgi:hypothetical protein
MECHISCILWKKRVFVLACLDERPTVPAPCMGLFMNVIDQQCEYQRKSFKGSGVKSMHYKAKE